MRNIEPLCEQYRNFFSKKYFGRRFEFLSEEESKKCISLSKVWAYKKSILPEGFDNFTIFDFTGRDEKSEKVIIDPAVTYNAKDKICKYCWGVSWDDLNSLNLEGDVSKSFEFFKSHRKTLFSRRKKGQSVVIHGDAYGKKGRTFISSLIMKEAIMLQFDDHPSPAYSYDWIDFTQLVSAAEEDEYDYAVYNSCDWIVIDNIIRRSNTFSSNQKAYLIGLWNNFFIQRYRDKLPTILVLKFNIKEPTFDPESEYGSGFAQIINDQNTLLIDLSKGSDLND